MRDRAASWCCETEGQSRFGIVSGNPQTLVIPSFVACFRAIAIASATEFTLMTADKMTLSESFMRGSRPILEL